MSNDSKTTASGLSILNNAESMLSLALLGTLGVLLIPMHPMLLDLLLSVNFAVTILLLLVVLGVSRALDISVFPSLLLLLTLFRLSLNVATTRLVLLEGDAGNIVSAFGGMVVGGNLVVGFVIFLILVIVQFIVITKGAGRVSEVAARFTLDALPGKQMAIDAELNAGAIDETAARDRRESLAREAEFYGAMDGASKFVRGDAIAGLIVTAVNLIGGMILGVSGGLTIVEAARRYSILTVGDGLVSQIPALIIATSAGILVTKTGSQISLGDEIGKQMLTRNRPLTAAAWILGILALVPGLPKLPFLAMSGGLFLVARRIPTAAAAESAQRDASEAPSAESSEENLFDDFLQSDRVRLEIGARLIPLVESRSTKGLGERIPGLRKDLTKQHGIWVPAVRLRDNLQLPQHGYRVMVAGREVASGEVNADRFLAIAPKSPPFDIEGEATKDPAFGLAAKWITASHRQRAEMGGYTVVDAAGVIVTHLGHVMRKHAHELLSRQDLQDLINKVKETSPSMVDEMKPDVLRLSTFHQVLVLLLQERVPVTDLAYILEATLNWAPTIKTPVELTEKTRDSLGRIICDRFRTETGGVRVVVLDPRLEHALKDSLIDGQISIAPRELQRLIESLDASWQQTAAVNEEVALLTDRIIRRPLRQAVQRALPDLSVIAYSEIPSDVVMEPVDMARFDAVFDVAPAASNEGDLVLA